MNSNGGAKSFPKHRARPPDASTHQIFFLIPKFLVSLSARIIILSFDTAMPTRRIFIDTPALSDVQRRDVVAGIHEAEIQFADHIAQSFGGRDVDWLIR